MFGTHDFILSGFNTQQQNCRIKNLQNKESTVPQG